MCRIGLTVFIIHGNFMIIVALIIKITSGFLLGNRHSEAAWKRAGNTLVRGKYEEDSKLLTSGSEGFQG
jgi:hypothetical protein